MLCPNLPHSWMLVNYAIHRRLCKTRLVSFIVPIAAIANQVDHEIFAEFLAIRERSARCLYTSDWIIRIDVHHWNFKAFGEVTGKHTATRFTLIRCKS